MKHTDFAHLHLHTQYSLLDGIGSIDAIVKKAVSEKMPAVAITDHGNMFGAIEFYSKCLKAGVVKPIIGCEVYIAPKSRFDKTLSGLGEYFYHLTLLATNQTGYKNLVKLASVGYTQGFYKKPRIDKQILSELHSGLIGLSGCIKGEIAHLILTNQEEEAKKVASEYKQIFGEGKFFLEIQNNGIKEQVRANEGLIEISKLLDIPLVATADVHYLESEHSRAQEILLCIETKTNMRDPKRLKFGSDQFYFRSAEEMKELFREIPESYENTIKIAQMCNVQLNLHPKRPHLPNYDVPEGKEPFEHLKELCYQGLKKRNLSESKPVIERLENELKIVKQIDYAGYFLIVSDFVRFAKNNNIPVGPGRGSVVGSIISFCLGITDINPLRYGLLFERFLNPERISYPDIDMDFCDERRDEVLQYVSEKYGRENVGQIVTFQTLGAKAVIRNVARSMGIPYEQADKIARMVPDEQRIELKSAIKQNPQLADLIKKDRSVQELMDICFILEGATAHMSRHAAGVVISDTPLADMVPMCISEDRVFTQYDMKSLEMIGLLKMDFLGLKTLAVIKNTVELIKTNNGKNIDINNLPMDDKKTYELLQNANTLGVFQLESQGMQDVLKKIKPNVFEDIVAAIALYRPGPMKMIDDFIAGKHKSAFIEYAHPKLEPVLKETYGIMLYQEQVMQITHSLAGFSLGRADILRIAMGKKDEDLMEKQRKDFVDGAVKNGVKENVADKIFGQIKEFAGYGFNKSHSVGYASIAYQTAYLKANFPLEFMTALLTSEIGKSEKIVEYIQEANRMQIPVLPPDINSSFEKFSIEENSIRFGLCAVKNIGSQHAHSIVSAREKLPQKYQTLYEFCENVNLKTVNRKVIESLIKCGAFDSLKIYRSQAMAIIDTAIGSASGIQKEKQRGQKLFLNIFNQQPVHSKESKNLSSIKEYDQSQLLAFEKEVLGLYLSGHPLTPYINILKNYAEKSTSALSTAVDGSTVVVGGMITKVKTTATKKDNLRMAIFILEDWKGKIEVILPPEPFRKYHSYVREDEIVFVKGRVNGREEKPKIFASEVIAIDEAEEKFTIKVVIEIPQSYVTEGRIQRFKDILLESDGKTPVEVCVLHEDGKKTYLEFDRQIGVAVSYVFKKKIEDIFCENCVNFISTR